MNYYIKQYNSELSGWGAHIKAHKFWIVKGDAEPASIKIIDRPKTFRYCHIGEGDQDVLDDFIAFKSVNDKPIPEYGFELNQCIEFLQSLCLFLNEMPEVKSIKKGHFYIDEFKFPKYNSHEPQTIILNLVYSNEKRMNRERNSDGGFINKATGDKSITDFTCFGTKMRNKRKKLLQQICNGLNSGLITLNI